MRTDSERKRESERGRMGETESGQAALPLYVASSTYCRRNRICGLQQCVIDHIIVNDLYTPYIVLSFRRETQILRRGA